MKKIILLSLIFLGCGGSTAEQIQVTNILEYVGKPLEEVEKVLGEGTKLDDANILGKECPKYSFKVNQIEIIFIDDVADWITIKNLDDLDFANCSINQIGDFDCIDRDFKGDDVIRWKNVKGINEISLHRKYEYGKPTSSVDYAYVKVNTE